MCVLSNKSILRSKNRKLSKEKEDLIFLKLASMFFMACAAIIFILKLNDPTTRGNVALWFYRLAKNPVYLIIMGVLLAASLAFYIWCKVKKVDESNKTVASINYVSVLSYILASSIYFRYTNDYKMMLFVTIALALLYFVYYIYRNEFFVFSLSNLINAVALWCFISNITSGKILVKVLALIVMVAYLAYVIFQSVKQNDGKEKKLYAPVFVSTAIFAAGILCSLFVPSITDLTLIAVMVVQYIAAAVIYTIRLIREV